jgi:hypothetical protein
MQGDFQEVIKQAHRIMEHGAIKECVTHIPKGGCSCCTFDKNLGNWIGLVPGEFHFLKKGDMSKWVFGTHGAADSLTCERGGPNCTNKPLDCKLYPFFPKSVSHNRDVYIVTFIAGFPKCPLKNDPYFQKNILHLDSHLGRCTQVAILLFKSGLDVWMRTTAEAYKGYDRTYTVRFVHGEYELSYEVAQS